MRLKDPLREFFALEDINEKKQRQKEFEQRIRIEEGFIR